MGTGAAFAGSGVAQANAQTFKGVYTVSYLGLPVARSSFVSTFAGENISIEGKLASAGVAKW